MREQKRERRERANVNGEGCCISPANVNGVGCFISSSQMVSALPPCCFLSLHSAHLFWEESLPLPRRTSPPHNRTMSNDINCNCHLWGWPLHPLLSALLLLRHQSSALHTHTHTHTHARFHSHTPKHGQTQNIYTHAHTLYDFIHITFL